MDVFKLEIKVDSFFDNESKSWVVRSNEFNISGYGKTIKDAKEMLNICIKKALKPDELNQAQRINQLENNFRELRGQLISLGVKEDSCLIMSLDSVINKQSKQLERGNVSVN
ncbi:MAG: hypothetical protein A3K10_13715 [Bacteroidetes bacterium RIFCSPLOWO2_12_FULL_31_6]|nr:MAG: hypothetical protein A3K10_13715 [Bacteroidetes bacterium RIFCSPLOWO2_12_FULL_31_6]